MEVRALGLGRLPSWRGICGKRFGSTSYSGYEPQSKLLTRGFMSGIINGTTIGIIKGDTRSLDYGSYGSLGLRFLCTQLRNMPQVSWAPTCGYSSKFRV